MSLRSHILLLGAASLWLGLVATEEPTTEGLTSTSLMELTMIPHLESLESVEPGPLEAREASLLTSLLQAGQGSGSSSQENEESTILQSPQYFLEDEADANETSLDLGPPTDYTFPVSSQRTTPRGNETEHRDRWETATPQLSMDLADRVTHTSYTHALPDEDVVLLMEQDHRTQHREKDLQDSDSPGPKLRDDLLYSIVSSVDPSVSILVTEPERGKEISEEGDILIHGLDSTPEVGLHPSQVPPSAILPATSSGFVDMPAHPPEDPTRNLVQWKNAEGRADEDFKNRLAVPTGPHRASNEMSPPFSLRNEEHHTMDHHARKVPEAISSAPKKLDGVPEADESHKTTLPAEAFWSSPQVICKDWSNLVSKNYIILNMSDDINCELFRLQKGQQLLSMVEDAFSRKNDRLQETWVISLSKPNENDRHLLMTLVSEQGVVPVKDVLTALGDIRRNLAEIGIQNYSTTTSCQSRPSQTRSDYGKLFVVLVIIGSFCIMIIVSGLIYICWQRRLPKLKNMSRGEELHFVENGCHDNPTLDVTMDSQSEMQEKKPSLNGGTLDGGDGWNILINKKAKDEADAAEEDTHL
ncbi:podocalyxin-like protein 2 isoform X2 [Pleurodeles waltl]|uniref:podocalyxin-like protein 2 isoform X2 n=1 Tax=Pleurodeles waltl TaxID=8319 RepID=UPI0037097F0F